MNRSLSNSYFHRLSKLGVLCDTFACFETSVAHCGRQWQYLVVWRRIFSERVVIFEAFADLAWICGLASAPQPDPAKISGRLLHSIFAGVLAFFNRFSEMNLPSQAADHSSGFLRPRAEMQKCEKLMINGVFCKGVSKTARGVVHLCPWLLSRHCPRAVLSERAPRTRLFQDSAVLTLC